VSKDFLFSDINAEVRRANLVDQLRIRWGGMGEAANDERAEAAMEIVRLRIERDSARQHVLRLLKQFDLQPEEAAKRWGWDWRPNP
jgi:hypothetical protein